MLTPRLVFASLALFACVCSSALGQINLSNGSTSYSWDASNGTGTYSDTRYNNPDVVVQELWLIRYQDLFGAGTEFVNLDPDESRVTIGSSSADSITFNVTGSSGDPSVDVTLNFSMDDFGNVDYDFTVTDTDFFATTHTISLFNYFDIDLSGSNSVTGSASSILFTSSDSEAFEKSANDADGFQVGAPFDINNSLTSNVNFDLNNNGAAAGNVAGAFQWDDILPNNGSYSASGVFSVPEPGFGILGLVAMAGLGMIRRRK